MKQRSSKLKSLNVVSGYQYDMLTWGESVKLEKKMVNKQRRTLEKREAEREISGYYD